MGYDFTTTVFSWTVLEFTGLKSEAAQFLVSCDEDFTDLVYDSGKSKNVAEQSNAYNVNLDFKPRTRYFWKVSVWANDGDFCISPVSWFETGKPDEPWEAVWIKTPFNKNVHPYIRHTFYLSEEVKSARIYACGLGLYECEANGEKIGDEYLMPGYCGYNHWIPYQTYDISKILYKGENNITAILGNGWYKGRFGFDGGTENIYGDTLQFLCEIRVTTVGGKEITIGTGKDWQCCPSPVLTSNIYDGEIYDARCIEENWVNAEEADAPKVKITERVGPPILIRERVKPVEIIRSPAGETIIDFGQIMTGWMEFPCGAPENDEVYLQYGEILQDGCFHNGNLRTARAEYRYISNGEKAWVRPRFTFYGFRFVKVEGLSDDEIMGSEGCVIYSGLEHTGFIETSDPLVNRLFKNAFWGQKGNFLDVPTDCPQRDERMGWTGDAQVFAATASFNMNTAAFFRKYMRDMLFEQRTLNGNVPHVIPDARGRIAEIKGWDDDTSGGCAWSDAAAVIPWTMYLFYGDKTLLEEQYESMRLWTNWIKKTDDKDGGSRLWKCGFHYADWLSLDNPDKGSSFGGTDCYYVASAYYFYSVSLTAKVAAILGLKEDEQRYRALSEEVKAAFINKYFSPEGDITEKTQTAMVLALHLGLHPKEHRLAEDLRAKLDENNCHLETGFVGTPWLLPVLSDNGLQDYAYKLLFNDDYPSWLYAVHMGATTIWERWNSVMPDGKLSGLGMNSLNHYAYGSVVEWMYRYMCGINPISDTVGFRKVVIHPQTTDKLDWVKCSFISPMGEYRVEWAKENGDTVYKLKIPFDAKAEFIIDGQKLILMSGEHTFRQVNC